MGCGTPSLCTMSMGVGCWALTTLTGCRTSRPTTIGIDSGARWSWCLTIFNMPISCFVIFLTQSSEHATKRMCLLNLMPKMWNST